VVIEGVPVGVAGFAGVAPHGPVDEARLVTSVEEFATVYGAGAGVGGEAEASDRDGGRPHYLAEAVGAFFVNGGRRLYVSRIGHGLAAALEALAAVDEISMVAAPGMADASSDLIAHAERTGCFALIDAPAGTSVDDVRRFRARFDSGHAAIHHPWIVVGGTALPPSGFVAGVYARGDLERGVPKPSTGDAVRGAAALESVVEDSERALLNEEGVNVLRPIEDEGIRIWGARTMSSDPEWKYVNIRRYLIFLEHSIDKGTQWAVFEPNGEELWARVRQAVEEFLSGQWHFGALRGRRPEDAFFVRCDPTTMTQDDIDGGRLVATIGVAPLRPAEFVIFRIGQWTADRPYP
jgi:phage tail sheath protein FI